MRISCKDVSAETLYDVLHDTHYRKKWDSNMIETYDIGRLTVNADVGYYSCEQPSCWGDSSLTPATSLPSPRLHPHAHLSFICQANGLAPAVSVNTGLGPWGGLSGEGIQVIASVSWGA